VVRAAKCNVLNIRENSPVFEKNAEPGKVKTAVSGEIQPSEAISAEVAIQTPEAV
jgi:hypothetical protein